MYLKKIEIYGFKSFAKKTTFDFGSPTVAIVGPNGSGKSNVAEAMRFVLGEQSMKSMRGKRGEDLIWNGSSTVPRMNRAGVSLVFDNSSHFLNVDFDEVAIERIVHRDGVNEYRMNGSQVRLKDILGTLAAANIGQSGHHIISQGEADKILSATPRERKEMIEDALGLKVYQYKLEEAERKLEKTHENVKQIEALRREIAPHVRFLKKQVEKVEKVKELRESAAQRAKTYFKREETYISSTKEKLSLELSHKKKALEEVEKKVAEAKKTLQGNETDVRANKILELSQSLDAARAARSDAAKKAARLEGQIEVVEKTAHEANIPARDVAGLIAEGEGYLTELAPPNPEGVIAFLRAFVDKLKTLIHSAEKDAGDLNALRSERNLLVKEEKEALEKEKQLENDLEAIRTELDRAREKERQKERDLFELAASEREVRHETATIEGDLEKLSLEEEEFKREIAEAGVLFGKEILSYTAEKIEETLSRAEQEQEKRELEKIKIRLEEMGASGGEEVMKEYQEISEREAFLARELEDLEKAALSLKGLIEDLETELAAKFKDGIDAINKEFTTLFSVMFDGGSASLIRVKEPIRGAAILDEFSEGEEVEKKKDEEFAEGIDISLSIPRKRVKSLVMLSGGERALTSIALIFAMSSVNPPPFIVLDETDAALDESNSRRYGDMVESLAKKSQLVLITHNRETMARAGILYGVTMGGDGVSKVLSVKLEEAVKVAK